MPHLRIDFQSVPPGVTVDVLISKIIDQIPGTRITAEDWYADRRIYEEKSIDRLKATGRRMTVGKRILKAVDRAAASHGPTKRILVPMDGKGSLEGRISWSGMLLHSDLVVDEVLAGRLVAVIQSLGILKDFRISRVSAPWKKHGKE